jgi:hypothetical protein
MVATMQKANKQYECEDLSQIDWSTIKRITGKPIPAIAEKMVKDVIKLTPKQYKAPYGKLGVIDGDTVLRLKDGSTHIADLILVKAGETPPAKNEPAQLTAQEQQAVDRYRQAKEGLPDEVKAQLQLLMAQLESVDAEVDRIKNSCEAVLKAPVHQQAVEMRAITDRRQQADDRLQAMRDLMDRTRTQLMDPHRSGEFAKPPDAAQGDLRKEVLAIAMKGWTGANSTFSKMEGVIKQAESLCRMAASAVLAAQNNVGGAVTAGQARLKALQDTTTELENEYQRIFSSFGGKNTASDLQRFVEGKTKSAAAVDLDGKHEYMAQVISQMKLVAGKSQQVYAGLDQLRQQVATTVGGVDKGARSNPLVKPILERLAKVAKDCEKAKKKWQDDLASGVKSFETMKVLVGTDKKAAERVAQKAQAQ